MVDTPGDGFNFSGVCLGNWRQRGALCVDDRGRRALSARFLLVGLILVIDRVVLRRAQTALPFRVWGVRCS